MKRKILFYGLGTFVLGVWFIQPNVFAESKKQLAHLVMEHDIKIGNLEKLVENLGSTAEKNEDSTPEVKEALLKEIELRFQYNASNLGKGINITHYDLKDVNGTVTLQFFTEGDYDWGQTLEDYGIDGTLLSYGDGRIFANSVIGEFDRIFKLYGLSHVKYEFYQNGERVKFSPDIE